MANQIDPAKDLADVRASIRLIERDLADARATVPAATGRILDRSLARVAELDAILARLERSAERLAG